MADPSLRELRIALCVANSGSFRSAAKQLDTSPSTLSHAVTTLERSLGLRLFHRTTRSIATTLEGAAFLTKIASVLAELDVALSAPTGDPHGVSGTLRINTPFSAALFLLEHLVPSFAAAYPNIDIELRHEERLVDIVAHGCDAGIRLGRTVPADMIGVRFGNALHWLPVASPMYLERHGTPSHPRDLMAHRCIRIRMPDGERYAWDFAREDEKLSLDVPGSLTLDRMALMVEAAVKGLGIAYVLRHTVEERLGSGALEPLLPEWTCYEGEYMLYYPGRRVVQPQLRAFIDFMRSHPTGSGVGAGKSGSDAQPLPG